MSRRSRPANRFGCKPDGDVCLAHDMPLITARACQYAAGIIPSDELVALRKDAERYRWLRENWHLTARATDDSIDSAMRAEGEKG